MEKRLFLAVGLSLLVLLTWSNLVSRRYHIENKDVTAISPAPSQEAPVQTPAILQQKEPLSGPLLKYTQDDIEINFIESKAAIEDLVFHSYQAYQFPLKLGLWIEDSDLNFQKQGSAHANEMVFVHSDVNKKIVKRFTFSNSNYDLWLEIEFQNLSDTPLTLPFSLVLGILDFSHPAGLAQFKDIAIDTKGQVVHNNARKDLVYDETTWVGLRDRYFCAIIAPSAEKVRGYVKRLGSLHSQIGIRAEEITLLPQQTEVRKFHIYLGPQELKTINRIDPNWAPIVYFGKFDLISQLLSQFLAFLYGIVKNWGWAIIILSLAIYLLLFPLTLKQMRSMKEMQALQPRVTELRNTYKDNPQKLNKEIMELYREHKINPFGGCLPLLLQIPVFFALYQALMRLVALKGATFLWIKDLSEPDRLIIFSGTTKLPIIGNELNALPIAMALLMFLQQKLSLGQAGSTGSAEQQRLMSILFPIMFGFIFYRMPSGLVLYWLINSALTFLYQMKIRQKA